MIRRTHFSRKAQELGMVMNADREWAWTIPIKVVMLWRDDRIFIIPNSVDALSEPVLHSLVAFIREGEVEVAFATYQLMNQGG